MYNLELFFFNVHKAQIKRIVKCSETGMLTNIVECEIRTKKKAISSGIETAFLCVVFYDTKSPPNKAIIIVSIN
jgi:hypothetical protein